jgi:hypothetical protein
MDGHLLGRGRRGHEHVIENCRYDESTLRAVFELVLGVRVIPVTPQRVQQGEIRGGEPMFFAIFALVRLLAYMVYGLFKLMIWLAVAMVALVAAACTAISTASSNRRVNRGSHRI